MRKSSNGKQIMGIQYSADWIANPDLIEESLGVAKGNGISGVIGFVRHRPESLWTERTHRAIARSVEIAHRLGLEFYLDMDPSFWGRDFVLEVPEAAMWVVKPVEVDVRSGRFIVETEFPNVLQGDETSHIIYDGVVAAYRLGGEEKIVPLDSSRLKVAWENSYRIYGVRSFDREQEYNYYRKMDRKHTLQMEGTFREKFSGKAVIYIKCKVTNYPDMAHPEYLRAQIELLERYADIPLDGVGWDEPGKAASQRAYKAGAGFCELFRRLCGYDLFERIGYLDYGESSRDAIRLRRDYFMTLREMMVTAQDEFNRRACKLFGKDIFRGTHQTWSGFPADLRGGQFDYFKGGRVLSAAFVDCAPCDFRVVVYNYILADSVRKELGLREAYSNDYQFVRSAERLAFLTRLKMLFHIQWFNIFIGEASESLPNYTAAQKALWEQAGKNNALLDRFDEFLAGEYQTHSQIGIWHLWEGPAQLNNFYVRAYYTFLQNLSWTLVERNLSADFFSTEALEKARIEGNRLIVNGRPYRALIVPYAAALPDGMYRKIMEVGQKGISVFVVGPPVQYLSTSGKDISRDFCKRVAVKHFCIEDMTRDFRARMPRFTLDEWEPPQIDYFYPVDLEEDAEVKTTADGEVFSVAKKGASIYYVPGLDPKGYLADILEGLIPRGFEVYCPGGFWRLFRARKGGKNILLTIAGIRRRQDFLVKLGSREVRIRGGQFCALEIRDGKVIRTFCDEGCVLRQRSRR